MSERAKSHMGGKSGSKKSESHGDKPHEMNIKRAHGGGFVVTHHKAHKPGMDMNDPETHVVPDADQLQQHVSDNMGDQPPAGTPPPDPNAAPPQGTPAAAPPGM